MCAPSRTQHVTLVISNLTTVIPHWAYDETHTTRYICNTRPDTLTLHWAEDETHATGRLTSTVHTSVASHRRIVINI